MNLPDPLKKALAEQPKYNPSVPAVNLNRMKRGDRKMLDDTACDTERSERVSDRHSAEARMLDEILGDHNVPKKISGNRRRSREPQPSYGSNGSNGSDDESVTSVSSRSERVKPLQARDIGAPQSVGQPGVSPRVRLSQKKSAPCSNKSASAGGDLLSAMTVRLTTLEMKYSVAVKESLKKDSVIEKLKKRNATLKKAGEDSDKNNGSVVGELEQVCEGLREEVAQMKMFLKDYGLVWVGAGEASEGVEEKVRYYHTHAPMARNLGGGENKVGSERAVCARHARSQTALSTPSVSAICLIHTAPPLVHTCVWARKRRSSRSQAALPFIHTAPPLFTHTAPPLFPPNSTLAHARPSLVAGREQATRANQVGQPLRER